jgi:sulfite exporter TauE/SafE
LVGVVATFAVGRGLALLVRSRRDVARISVRPPRPGLPSWIGRLLPRRGLGLGLVTGLLPCGMLAAAWALAAASGHALRGALVMAVFCAASAPALLLPLLAARPFLALRRSEALAGVLWCALGVWLGVRPLLDAVAHHGGH